MTTPLLAKPTKSMICGVGRGKLNRVSTHLKTEDIGIGTYKPTPLEIWMDRAPYEPTV